MKKKWLLVALSVTALLSIPSIWHKIQTEQSAPVIEFSIDYLSLLELSKETENPTNAMTLMLTELKKAEISTITLPNNTFASLESRGKISVLTGSELHPFHYLSADDNAFDSDLTYVLVLNPMDEPSIYNLLATRFPASEVTKHSLNGNEFLGINLPTATVLHASVPFLEEDKDFLTQPPFEFSLIAKIDNQWDGQEQLMIEQLDAWDASILSKIYFSDAGVLGFPTDHMDYIPSLPNVPFSYKEYFDGESKQLGINRLAEERNNNIVRLHAVPSSLFISSIEEPEVLSNRLILAAKERNIRTFHLQFPVSYEDKSAEALFNESVALIQTAQGKLAADGYRFGVSNPFNATEDTMIKFSRAMAFLSGILLVTLLVQSYAPKWSWLTFIALSTLSVSSLFLGTLAWQTTALVVSIGIPLLSATWLLRQTKQGHSSTWVRTLGLFLGTSFVSLIGAFLVVGMHSGVEHSLYLSQFRGVSIAHYAPPLALVGLMLWQMKRLSLASLTNFMNEPIRLYQALLIGLIGCIGFYYLSRTGNSGILIPFEADFRALMQDVFGVRPRTKEFLIAHPLLLVIIFYWHRLRYIKWLLPVAIIGQISIVNTFTHLHTPTAISFFRSLYGIGLGAVIGLLVIFVTETIWRKWKTHKHVSE